MSASAQFAPQAWVDPKRYLWLLSAIVPSMAIFSVAMFFVFRAYGLPRYGEIWLWGAPILIHGLIPALDMAIGADSANPPEEATEALENNPYYRILLFAYVPTQYVLTILVAWVVTHVHLTWFGWFGAVLSAGGINGLGINTAHELGHKLESAERWGSRITLALAAYGHFYTEHNRGHHVRVATPEDPASSRMGESFYAFFPRTVWYSMTSAWDLEKRRLARKNLSVFSWHNEVLQSWAMTWFVFGAITIAFGWHALPFLLLQAFYAFSLLEVVNYLEHYGLARRKLPNGRYEPCTPVHSWNSNHLVTNLFLYQLQRHSDHHANPLRRYQSLRHFEESPQLPGGYATMILAAYIPPLWYRVMDKRILAHYDGDLGKASIQPGRRRAIERRLRIAA